MTNFVSGRDPDSSLILEKIYDEKEVQSDKTRIWNFHVWNEVWMRRADLQDSAYHGWQALDASRGQEEEGDHKFSESFSVKTCSNTVETEQ